MADDNQTAPVRDVFDHGARERRLTVLAAGLAGGLYLAGVGLAIAFLPAMLMLFAGRPFAALAIALAGLIGGIVALPVLIAPRLLPASVVLSRAIAPGLHGQLEMLRRRLAAPRVDEVVLDHGFDMRVAYGGRSLFSPRARRQLIIGLPLMHALSAAEFRALMAREVATLSRGQGRLSLWVAALHEHWRRLAAASGASPFLRIAGLHRFLGWYVSWLAERARPALVGIERSADRMAGAIGRPDDLAAAILRVALAIRFIDERVLPEVRSQIRRFGEPASGVHARFEQALRGAFDDPRFDRWLVDALSPRRYIPGDRPPADVRLDAIGFGMNRTEAFGRLLRSAFSARKGADTAASHYLGPNALHVIVSLEKSWIDQARASQQPPSTRAHGSGKNDGGAATATPATKRQRARSA